VGVGACWWEQAVEEHFGHEWQETVTTKPFEDSASFHLEVLTMAKMMIVRRTLNGD